MNRRQAIKSTALGLGAAARAAWPPSMNAANGRAWFAWANTLFGEFVLKVLVEHPHRKSCVVT